MDRDKRQIKCELYNDNFQNYKRYNIPKAQLVIADIPYNIGVNAYASNPEWYNGGNNQNGESKKAGKGFFNTDFNFNIAEYFHFCNRLLKKEPKERGKAPAMIVFCAFEQIDTVIRYGTKYGRLDGNWKLKLSKGFSECMRVLRPNGVLVFKWSEIRIPLREILPLFSQRPLFGNRCRKRGNTTHWLCFMKAEETEV